MKKTTPENPILIDFQALLFSCSTQSSEKNLTVYSPSDEISLSIYCCPNSSN